MEKITKKQIKYILVCFFIIMGVYITWLLCRIFIMDRFVIPSESMYPTLVPGDRVLVDKTEYGARLYKDLHFDKAGVDLKSFRTRGLGQVNRNDVVAFNMPNNGWKIKFIINYVYCKRCIALPGDSISAVNSHYINNNYAGVLGLKSEQDKLASLPDNSIKCGFFVYPYDHIWTIKNFGPLYIPRKGDIIDIHPKEGCMYGLALEWELKKKIVVDWEKGTVTADGKPITRHRFLHNYYFMAGDNIIDSDDSRYWGLVPEEYIIGKVVKVLYSKDKKTNKLRWNRFLKNM